MGSEHTQQDRYVCLTVDHRWGAGPLLLQTEKGKITNQKGLDSDSSYSSGLHILDAPDAHLVLLLTLPEQELAKPARSFLHPEFDILYLNIRRVKFRVDQI